MKLFLCIVLWALTAPIGWADPIDSLIEEYEAYVSASSPAQASKRADAPPSAWPDVSQTSISLRASAARDLLLRLNHVETERVIDRAILQRLLMADLVDADFDTARVPFTGDWGFYSEPTFTAMRLRIRNEADADAWIARLLDTQRYFDQNIENMRRGIDTGWTAHADPLATMRDQIQQQIVEDPTESGLYAPFLGLPASIPDETAERLQADGLEAVQAAIDAYATILAFIEEDYASATRVDAGIANEPDGRDYYSRLVEIHTAGAGYSPEEIHSIGVAEVARIRDEMDTIIAELAFDGSFEEFIAFLRTDPQFYAGSAEELMAAARDVSGRLNAMLPVYFGRLPILSFNVRPVPASIAPGFTTGRYAQGDPQKGQPGTYLVNTYALDQRPLYELPALSAHEAVPGHHLQITLAQEMRRRPRFRQDYYATAFGEGWGLYAERLAGEGGIYRTPYERFGALSMEMWRACRLVADTGLHWYGWTRAEAETCFIENSALSELNIKTEVTRYIGWPGQATAYKIGELKILELRERAQRKLGSAFDLRRFHDMLLAEGAVPLDVLEWRVDTWIADQLPHLSAPPAPPPPFAN